MITNSYQKWKKVAHSKQKLVFVSQGCAPLHQFSKLSILGNRWIVCYLKMCPNHKLIKPAFCVPFPKYSTYYRKWPHYANIQKSNLISLGVVLCAPNKWDHTQKIKNIFTLFFLLSLYFIRSKMNVKTSLGHRLWTSLSRAIATGIVCGKMNINEKLPLI